MKTGTHPMKTKLKLFFEWGIRFEKPLQMPDRGSRPVHYAGKADLERAILRRFTMASGPTEIPVSLKVQAAAKPASEKKAIRTSTED